MTDYLPWIAGVLVVVALLALAALRSRDLAPDRDPVRLFTPAQKLAARERCGGRCEHIGTFWRCRAEGTAGDHIYPWSRGGRTIESNLQMLCTSHNSSKGAKVPSRRQIRRLERRRRRYFPPGADVKIRWR